MADAFQPRFVDLVRNYTDTVGTGDLVLGAPVDGFTSFTAALQPGDRFYYSVAALQKPAESEVGRGTLLADGSISRDPISGTPTDFSKGVKTVALVTAAEWFPDMQARPIGGAMADGDKGDVKVVGGVWSLDPAAPKLLDKAQHVPDRAALAAAATSGAVAYLRETGREGLFLWKAGDQSAEVASDPAQGVRVAPQADPSGASGNVGNPRCVAPTGSPPNNRKAFRASDLGARRPVNCGILATAGKARELRGNSPSHKSCGSSVLERA